MLRNQLRREVASAKPAWSPPGIAALPWTQRARASASSKWNFVTKHFWQSGGSPEDLHRQRMAGSPPTKNSAFKALPGGSPLAGGTTEAALVGSDGTLLIPSHETFNTHLNQGTGQINRTQNFRKRYAVFSPHYTKRGDYHLEGHVSPKEASQRISGQKPWR